MRSGAILIALLLTLALGACGLRTSTASQEATPLDPAVANVYALFVGIDTYRYSDARVPSAAFSDLKGAVNDTGRFKQALASFYGLDVDKPEPDKCASHNAVSITLTDLCATRAQILDALNTQVDSLGKGDTLLFYFAGHGARYADDEVFDQDTGYNGTILPADARNPDGSVSDIYDVELKMIKDRATQAGIYFVTIFDSCNSATATRDGSAGFSRSAPPTSQAPPTVPNTPKSAGQGGGYWVHLAAAQDGEEAQETPTGTPGKRSGVFTTALIETLRDSRMRHATFGDIIREIRLQVAKQGHSAQTPSAEGKLTAALGAPEASAALFDAEPAGGAITLAAGSLSGVTKGSRFALYANQADAKTDRKLLGEAVVTQVDALRSRLAPANAADKWPSGLIAREVAHFLAPDLVQVSIALPLGKQRDAVAEALAAVNFATLAQRGSTRIVPAAMGSDRLELRAADGTLLAGLGKAGDAKFAHGLTAELQKIARVRQLLALRTAGGGSDATVHFPVATCIALDGYNRAYCPPLDAGAMRRIGKGDKFTVTAINRGTVPAFLYVLAISPSNTVTLVVPRSGELDQKIAAGMPYSRAGVFFRTPGSYQFVTIATDRPIRADALEQDGNGTRDTASCTTSLERLLCDANVGLRDPAVKAVGDWSAQVTSVLAMNEGERP